MKKLLFKHIRFVQSASDPSTLPVMKSDDGNVLHEIAVAGRSNVGKSSLLNHLFQQRNLVKTSSQPGKTQLLNLFVVDDVLSFVDLPGYGYAKVPLNVRKAWGPMIQGYLEKRPALKLILFLFDIRRMPNAEDKDFIEWVAQNDKAMILVLTKVDKVTVSQRAAHTRKILQVFNCENLHHVHYSATKHMGRKALIAMMLDALAD